MDNSCEGVHNVDMIKPLNTNQEDKSGDGAGSVDRGYQVREQSTVDNSDATRCVDECEQAV
jgi:hypothetical protein